MNDERLNLPATETINDICLFAEKLKERLEQKYKQYQVTVQQVTKNNGVKLTGISILENGCITAPTIYLEDLFEQYQQGASLEYIICIILNQYVQIGHDLPILNFYDFSEEIFALGLSTQRKMQNYYRKVLIVSIMTWRLFITFLYLRMMQESPVLKLTIKC